MTEWIQEQDLYRCCLQATHFRSRDTDRSQVREWKKIFHANGIKTKLEYQYSADKIDFKIKAVTRCKEGHYIMIQGSLNKKI